MTKTLAGRLSLPSLRANKLAQGAAVGFLAGAIATLCWGIGLFDAWEAATWDWRARSFAGPGAATSKIRLVLLDQGSLDWGKKVNGWSWPWPREVYTAIVAFLKRQGARAIIFDVIYTEPSVYGVADDEALGTAIADGPPFVGALFLGETTGEATAWPEGLPPPRLSIDGLDAWLASPDRIRVAAPRATFPIPEVAKAAKILANVQDDPDPDSVFRRVRLFRTFAGRPVPSIALGAMLAGGGATPPALRIEEGALHAGETAVPIDGEGRAILRFRGRAAAYRPVSADAVIQSELRILEGGEPPISDPEIFKDAYVIFAFSAPALMDVGPTPMGPVSPRALVHATALDNLLSGDFVRPAPAGLVVLATFILAIAAGILIVPMKRAWQSVSVSVVFLAVPLAAGFGAYALGLWWPVIAGEGAAALAFAGALAVQYATEGKQKRFIKNAFKYYLSADVIHQIIKDPSRLTLGGEKRELTIFFSDLASFSSISERLDPPGLTALLNDYLSDMTDIILEEGGTLDKYEGDAIIAFWNAPVLQEDHAIRGVRTAIRCQRQLAARADEFRERAGMPLRMRIGMNTGDVVVGNMGSRERFNYTILGDAANLASRLEGANKAFGSLTMVAESTWRPCGGAFSGREIARLRVVGRKTPVTVFEVFGSKGEGDRGLIDGFARALSLFYEGKLEEAGAAFEDLGDDPVSKAYAARCRAFAGSPREGWDGVWSLTEK
ncbi:MAG: adenylate/guanylate cyclase domain-containing protein [Planctomycetes bacterium]|nr:adenylate/guanylate cyclase domain-containing protein [Planctomycetota bacterium]